MPISDDDLLKAKVSSGPESSDGAGNNPFGTLIESIDLLTESILYTLNDSISNQTQTLHDLVNQINQGGVHGRQFAADQTERSRDVDQLKEHLGPVFEDLKTSILDTLNLGLGGVINIAGQSVNLSGSHFGSPLGPFGSMYARGMGSAVTSAFGVQDPMVSTLMGEGMHLAAGHLQQFVGGLSSASKGLGVFTTALGGIVVVLAGISEAFSAFQSSVDYQKIILRNDPIAYGVFGTGGMGYHQFRSQISSELLPGRSEADIDRLLGHALGMRPGAEGTPGNVSSMAKTIGMLEDYGVSPQTTQRTGYTMMKDLQLNYQQTERAIISLAGVATQHGIEITSYMEKITQLAKTVRGLGITVEDVNKLFNKFMTDTFENGMKVTASVAMEATEMALGMSGRLSLGEAAYIAMTTASGKTATGSPIAGGFVGMPETMGQLSSDPLGSLVAANAVRMGLVGQQPIYDHVSGMVDMYQQASGGQNLSIEAQSNVRKILTDKYLRDNMGFTGRYGIDEGYTAFVGAVAEGKLSEEDFKKGLKEWSGDPLTRLYEQVKDHTNIFKDLQEMIAMIRDVLAGIFLPIMQGGVAYLAAIAKFITTGNPLEAIKELERMQSMWQEYNENPSGLRGYYVGTNEITGEEYEKWLPTTAGRAMGVWGQAHVSPEIQQTVDTIKLGLTAAGAGAGALIGAPAGPGGMLLGALIGGGGALFGSEVGENLAKDHLQDQKNAQMQQQYGTAPKTLKTGISMDVHHDHDHDSHELASMPKGFIHPLLGKGSISSGYGRRSTGIAGASRMHAGVDLAAAMGTPVYAAESGRVNYAGWYERYGNTIDIGHSNVDTRYAHLSKIAVKPGQQVKKGDLIGYVGNTGISSGPHLHYEVRKKGKENRFGFGGSMNPLAYMNKPSILAQAGTVKVDNTVNVKVNGKPVQSKRIVEQSTLTKGYKM